MKPATELLVKTAPELLRAYLEGFRNPSEVAALFEDDGVVELPYMNARVQGPAAIQKLVENLLRQIPDMSFHSIDISIQTPEQAFAEYHVEAPVPATGRLYKQHYFGRLVAKEGKIKLLREALNTHAVYKALGIDPDARS